RPRSSPTTCRPASASSLARMEPLKPTPTTTASTGFSFVAMSVLSHEQHMLRMTMLVERGLALEDVGDRHRQRVVRHAVLFNEMRVHRGDARKADELPADLAAVAAVDRIGEEALDGVLEQHVEEEARRHRLERKLALLERAQHLVLLRGGELVVRFPVLLGAAGIDLGDRRAIDLLRRERRLIALLRRALGVRALAVHLRHHAVAAEELLVDEIGDARFLRAGTELVRGNEPRDGSIEERNFGRREEHVFLALRARVARMLRGCGRR